MEFFRCGQVGAKDGVGGGYFGDCVRVQVVGSVRQVFPKRDFKLIGIFLQGEMLIADGGGTAGWIDSQRDKGEIKILFGLVGYFDRSLPLVGL